MRKLTTEWLIEEDGCVEGVKWFKKNYPNGMIFTKKNINELVGRLLRKKKLWDPIFAGKGNRRGVCNNLDWLLGRLGRIRNESFNHLPIKMDEWNDATKEEIVEAFWKTYKEKEYK